RGVRRGPRARAGVRRGGGGAGVPRAPPGPGPGPPPRHRLGGCVVSAFSDVSADTVGAAVLDRLRTLVELESPSDDEAGLRAVAGAVAAQLVAAGAAVDTVDVPGVGEHLVARVPGLGGPTGGGPTGGGPAAGGDARPL